MNKDIQKYLDVAKLAAISAGEYLLKNFGLKHDAEFKSESDVVLVVDKGSESIILEFIKKNFPNHSIYSEEIGEINNQSEFTWFIDPLDGTNNYFAGIPYFSVSIALKFKSELIVGVVFNPIANQLFEATLNGGAFLDGELIESSKNTELKKSVCSFIQGHNLQNSEELVGLKSKISQNFRRVISTWAPALDWTLLANGGIDALICYDSEIEDLYAGLLIAKEAGVKVLNFSGGTVNIDDRRIVASNKFISERLLELIKK